MSLPSNAERKVHRLLKEVNLDGYTALHSLGLSEHDYKITGEIDFLLVGPDGIFVLEVKGGKVASRDGIWIFTDRYGTDHRKKEGPFDQAKSAAFSLMDRLRPMVAHGSLNRVPFGWGCVFPDFSFGEPSVEWSPRQVIDLDDLRSPDQLTRAIRSLVRYSVEKFERPRRLEPEVIADILRVTRPDFDKVPSLGHRADEIDEQALSLTAAQYKYLDVLQRAPRILCDGGAGTGKTFLAVEAARRESAAGQRTLVTCRSEVVARFISSQKGMDDERIVIEPYSRAQGLAPFDTLIVDEGQDLMNLDDLLVFEGLLAGGLGGGRWRIFLDRNHQTGVLGRFDLAALEMLETDGAVPMHLPDNCRNTIAVIEEVTAVVGADVGASLAGGGPPVRWRWWDEPAEGAELLCEHIWELMDGGVEPQAITVLCGGDPASDPVLGALSGQIKALIAPLNANSVVSPPKHRIGASRIGLYKGLESPFVCVVDIPSLTVELEPVGVAELYVAMTRPRAGLWMGLPRTLKPAIKKLGDMKRSHAHD